MKIKFDYKYAKMPEKTTDTHLVDVFRMHYDKLSQQFKIYDTEHADGYYEIPKTELLVLILISYEKNISGGSEEHLWTTVRTWTEHKEKLYKSQIGSKVGIEIINTSTQ